MVRRDFLGPLFASPWLIGFLLLILYPFAASFYWSLCHYDLLSPPRFVGLENYQRLADEAVSGGRFGQAMWNTGYFALLSVPLSILLGVSLAVMLSWQVRGQAIYRTLFFFCRQSFLWSQRPFSGCGCWNREMASSTKAWDG